MSASLVSSSSTTPTVQDEQIQSHPTRDQQPGVHTVSVASSTYFASAVPGPPSRTSGASLSDEDAPSSRTISAGIRSPEPVIFAPRPIVGEGMVTTRASARRQGVAESVESSFFADESIPSNGHGNQSVIIDAVAAVTNGVEYSMDVDEQASSEEEETDAESDSSSESDSEAGTDSDSDGGSSVFSMDQIDDILIRAEKRLREQQEALLRLSPTLNEDPMQLSKTSKSRADILRIERAGLPKPFMRSSDAVVKVQGKELVDDKTRALAGGGRKVENVLATSAAVLKQKKKTAPAGLSTHFDIPRTNLTPQLKRDLQLLHMRSVLDPKRMYKRQGKKLKIPTYSQVGTIVAGPTDFFSGRLNRSEQGRSFVDEALGVEQRGQDGREGGKLKRRYEEVQERKKSGKKAYYKGLMEKRGRKVWDTKESGTRVSKRSRR